MTGGRVFSCTVHRYYGPFLGLNADEIIEDVETMWRTLYKLSKTLHDNPGAKRIAELVRAKIEKFRQFSVVLQTICNKGLQKRHWDLVCTCFSAQNFAF